MSHVSTSAPDPKQPAPPVQNTFQLVSSAEMLRNKVNTVLSIMGQCTPLILDTTQDFESEKLRAQYDGGAADAAQVTYINACDRLDRLLKDNRNWKIDQTDKAMNARSQELHAINLQIAQARLERERHYNRPSILHDTKLFRRDNFFYAVLGDKLTDDCVYGKGETVAVAYANLDAVLASFPSEKPVSQS